MNRAHITYHGHAYDCWQVATVHIRGGTDIAVWHTIEDCGFFVADEGLTESKQHFNTLRQALSLAVRNAGWG